MTGLIVDLFAGGGGASLGLKMALGRDPDIAINHDTKAIAMHQVNHPTTCHLIDSVWRPKPRDVCAGRPVDVLWMSPDCTHFSKAKGAAPKRDPKRSKRSRGLAWVGIRWAAQVRPRAIFLENVEEFEDWGPLLADGRPCPKRKGSTFRRFVSQLERLGYAVDWWELKACDYGAPTIRKRLFLVARCDGEPIVLPRPTHGPVLTGLKPYRTTAADIIDWSIGCPSIFERKKPLAEATQKRIARGIKRYVLDNPHPFIVPVTHQGDSRVHGIDEPMRTITGAHRGEQALVTPFVARCDQSSAAHKNGIQAAEEPTRTITTSGCGAVIAPTLINTRNGERKGQAPRVRDILDPAPTVTAAGSQGAVVSAFLAQHNTGMVGHDARKPISTLTERSTQQQLVTAHMLQMKGSDRRDRPADAPAWAVTSQGEHIAEVRAFLLKYFGTATGQRADEPLHSATTKARFGLVTVAGELYQIADIGMRMLTPRELFRAQGFPDSYIIDRGADGKPLTKTDQIRMCGNSVCPDVAAALVRANARFAMTAEARARTAA